MPEKRHGGFVHEVSWLELNGRRVGRNQCAIIARMNAIDEYDKPAGGQALQAAHTDACTGQALQASIEDRLLRNRIVWLKDEVNDRTANEVINKLLFLHGEDPERDVFLYISSPGGSITAGMGIYDTMNFIGNDVVTVGVGMCASMGQFLLSSGTRGKRFLMPHARVLMHQPSGGIQGTETDVRIEAELISDMKREMAEITARQTGHSVDEILRDNEYDHWYTAKEALGYGFVDHIVNDEGELLARLADPHDAGKPSSDMGKPKKRTTAAGKRRTAAAKTTNDDNE